MLKRYYTIDESIKFLVAETKQPFADRDIFDLAKRGELSLCFYVNSDIGLLSPFHRYWEYSSELGATMSFQGYAKLDTAELAKVTTEVPVRVYSPKEHERIKCGFALKPSELYEAGGDCFIDFYVATLPVSNYTYFHYVAYVEPIDEEGSLSIDDARPIPIEPQRSDYVIPASQLLALVEAHQIRTRSVETPLPSSDSIHSPELTALLKAYRKFWVNADKDDKTTHVVNKTVSKWLVSQGFSESLAKHGAAIIRPTWADTGRPPEK